MSKKRGLSSRIDFEMASVLFVIGLASLYLFASNYANVLYSPNEAVFRIVPAQTSWIANGTMQYRVDIIADNRPLFPERTYGGDWQLVKPQGLENYIVAVGASANISKPQDFFNGYSQLNSQVNTNWGQQYRSIYTQNGGPTNRSGILASYWFTVSPGAQPGSYSFGINEFNTVFYSVDGSGVIEQPYHVESVPFTISKPKPTMATGVRAIPCTPGVNC